LIGTFAPVDLTSGAMMLAHQATRAARDPADHAGLPSILRIRFSRVPQFFIVDPS